MYSRTRPVLRAVVLAAIASSSPAFPFVVIDDFDAGTYYSGLLADTTEIVQPIGPTGAGHVISPDRRVSFFPDPALGGRLRAAIDNGAGTVSELQMWAESGYGDIQVEWDWGYAADLTEGGAVDSIAIVFTIAPPEGMNVVMYFEDVNGLHGIGRTISITSSPPRRYAFPLSDWGFIDMTQATIFSLKFQFRGQSLPQLFEVADVRTVGERAVTPSFIGDWTFVETNPLPSAPCVFRTVDPGGNPLYRTDIGWQQIQVGGDLPAIHGVWSARSQGAGETVDVYDVRGRLVRALRPAAGSASLAWDGRESSGADASPGVYFARREGASGGRPARIVLVR